MYGTTCGGCFSTPPKTTDREQSLHCGGENLRIGTVGVVRLKPQRVPKGANLRQRRRNRHGVIRRTVGVVQRRLHPIRQNAPLARDVDGADQANTGVPEQWKVEGQGNRAGNGAIVGGYNPRASTSATAHGHGVAGAGNRRKRVTRLRPGAVFVGTTVGRTVVAIGTLGVQTAHLIAGSGTPRRIWREPSSSHGEAQGHRHATAGRSEGGHVLH